MSSETTVGEFLERGSRVQTMHYRGGFPLDFLKPDERVRAGGDGAAEVVRAKGGLDDPLRRIVLVPLGHVLLRWPDGELQVASPQAFTEDFEEVSG